jgi:hemolysin III
MNGCNVTIEHKAPAFSWDYDRAEIIADGVVHAIGFCFGLIGGIVIIVLVASASAKPAVIAAVAIYAIALFAMLAISAAFNMWPVGDTKWILRRFDHSAIYVLIAGTYTPFIAQLGNKSVSGGLLAVLWLTAAAGVALKLMLPGRFDGVAIILYLLLGWCGVAVYGSFFALLPNLIFWLLAIGGALYSLGVIFHISSHLRFQNAIWHAFVLVAAICHFAAVLDYAALAQRSM